MPNQMLAIHNSHSGFGPHWIDYCREKGIPHKIVDCYKSDIVKQVEGCDVLLWHHSHSDPRDVVIAQQILFAHENAGLKVFPDFHSAWHFDDKVGQKYLFEALDIPRLETYVFVESAPALEWTEKTDFPKVFKLRHGASSSCVRLARNKSQARRFIRRAFRRGIPVYSPWGNLKDRLGQVRLGAADTVALAKGIGRFLYPPRFSRVLGRQRGYVLFQDFAAGNDSDVRVTVIGNKAFGVRRWVRPGDFRASGSGRGSFSPEDMDLECVELAFKLSERLDCQCMAFDFVRKEDNSLAVIEISYCFDWYGKSLGHWDSDLNWHPGAFLPQEWMVDLVLEGLG